MSQCLKGLPIKQWFESRHWIVLFSKSAILLGDMLLLKNPNDAQLASLNILRNSRWRPRWSQFYDFTMVCPILVYLFYKVCICLNKIIKQWTINTFKMAATMVKTVNLIFRFKPLKVVWLILILICLFNTFKTT